METKRGGKRQGAGRKKGMASIKAEEARKYAVNRILEELEPILTGQIERAKGMYYEKIVGQNEIKVYRTAPDSRVAEFLLNQLIGRPKELAEVRIDTSLIDPDKKAKIDRILGIV